MLTNWQFPADLLNERSGTTAKQTETAVREYARVLSAHAPQPDAIADIDKLPLPKDRLKELLKFAIIIEIRPGASRQLVDAFLSLAQFQPDVGDSIPGLDVSRAESLMNVNIDASISMIVDQESVFKRRAKWRPQIQTEELKLAAELKDLEDSLK